MKHFRKQPQEIKPFDIDFVDRLASGETVSSVTITVFDEDDADVSSTILDGVADIQTGRDGALTKVAQRVKAGSDGDVYNIEVLAVTSNSAEEEEDVELRIKKEGTR